MGGTGLSAELLQDQRPPGDTAPPGRRIRVGLVNNMPDSALLATERQFASLLGPDTDLQLFFLPETERGEAARRQLQDRYQPLDALASASLEGLIVTGAEPRAPDLRQEPYWPSFARLADWAEANTVSTIWSCLAAHAAVLHLDGIERRRLSQKLSGVFERVDAGGGSAPARVPHSRLNTLDEADLVRAGYTLLSRLRSGDVDAFVRRGRSRFVFLQGHPEYEAETLALEFQRDFSRYLRGQSERPPSVPADYFDGHTERAIAALIEEASRRPETRLSIQLARSIGARPPGAPWRASSQAFYVEWLAGLRAPMEAARRAI